ncbi:MAG: alpha-1,4-glucan--maltose-1-phosphate maltosyltransferase [Sandaracinaceae bacterium]
MIDAGSSPQDAKVDAARVVVARRSPRLEGGQHAVKRCVGDVLRIRVELVCDGHDHVAGAVRVAPPGGADEVEVRLVAKGNDLFEAEVPLTTVGRWELTVEGWVDAFGTWLDGLGKKAEVDEVQPVDLAVGAGILERLAARAAEDGDAGELRAAAASLADAARPAGERVALALAPRLREVADRWPDRTHAGRAEGWPVRVDPPWARFAAWYEVFPRSTGAGTSHGTFRTAIEWLPYIARLGFDVVYLPPIHPIGTSHRKGPNNTLTAGPDDPGSPWAIGAAEGGHTAVHPALGTLEDFRAFVQAAEAHGLRVALDIAFQASPDHPWVREHPRWFRQRPDGSIQYAENPPKKYQDVYPFDFETEDRAALWGALRDVFRHWMAQGVKIFRVDNPHTKPVSFWAWCIRELQTEDPEVTFLSEAFTRPSLKYLLGKVGFTQGYTYFTWRRTPYELRRYVEELTRTEVAEFFRPSFWPNTPDILPEDLQVGGRPAFIARLVMASTLSSHYGIYGPAFELMEREARPGSGEYIDNEKYEIKAWDLDRPDSLGPWIQTLNRLRREHPCLQETGNVTFHDTDNERLLCYSKRGRDEVIIVVVSFDPHHRQTGWTDLDLDALGVDGTRPFQVHDLLGEGRYLWTGPRNYVELDPAVLPAQLFAVRRYARTERDFDYYL